MDVLVAEAEPGDAAGLTGELVARGHRVRTCAPGPTDSAPCIGMTPRGRCPLDDPSVALLLDVRSRAQRDLKTSEFPAMCAMSTALPVIVCGPPEACTQVDWAIAACPVDDAVRTCEELSTLATITEGRSIADAVQKVLHHAGHTRRPQLEVATTGDHIVVTVTLRRLPDPRLARRLTMAIRLALRSHAWGQRLVVVFARDGLAPTPADPSTPGT